MCLFAWSSQLLLFPILSARSRRSRPAGLRARRRRGFSRFLFLAPRGFPPFPSSLARPHDLFRGRSERSCGAWKTTPTAPRLGEPFLACSPKSLRDALVSERRRCSVCASSSTSWFLPHLWPGKRRVWVLRTDPLRKQCFLSLFSFSLSFFRRVVGRLLRRGFAYSVQKPFYAMRTPVRRRVR